MAEVTETETDTNTESLPTFDPSTIERPDEALLRYYIYISALTLVGFPFVFLPLYFKYHTLRYKFDDKGVSMSWGILFKKEVYLTYRRIQDIHVTRNLFHRWLGLAAVSVQTASGTSGAEMTIEGIRNPEVLRDFLYAQMRGVKQPGIPGAQTSSPTDTETAATPTTDNEDEALLLLKEIRDNLAALGANKGEAS